MMMKCFDRFFFSFHVYSWSIFQIFKHCSFFFCKFTVWLTNSLTSNNHRLSIYIGWWLFVCFVLFCLIIVSFRKRVVVRKFFFVVVLFIGFIDNVWKKLKNLIFLNWIFLSFFLFFHWFRKLWGRICDGEEQIRCL